MSDFRSRVQALAAKEGKTVSAELKEDELRIAALRVTLSKGDERTLRFPASAASRLFIESEVRRLGKGDVSYLDWTEDLEKRAWVYYGPEYWDDEPDTGKHPIIDAIRGHLRIIIEWK